MRMTLKSRCRTCNYFYRAGNQCVRWECLEEKARQDRKADQEQVHFAARWAAWKRKQRMEADE